MITTKDKITVSFGNSTVLIAGTNNSLTLIPTAEPINDGPDGKPVSYVPDHFAPEVHLTFSTAKSVDVLIGQLDLVRQYLVNKELTKELAENIRIRFNEEMAKESECDCGHCPGDQVSDGEFLPDDRFNDEGEDGSLAGDEELT